MHHQKFHNELILLLICHRTENKSLIIFDHAQSLLAEFLMFILYLGDFTRVWSHHVWLETCVHCSLLISLYYQNIFLHPNIYTVSGVVTHFSSFFPVCSSVASSCFFSSGRTGRAGHQGKAITFFTENDKPLLRRYMVNCSVECEGLGSLFKPF